ncbi:tetratricopeptide repeat protein [Candidatus Methylopumilus planktonicus]|uniref:tetratricopeptide repeat-containing sulfotransferase family protein n=1 Tax=Candidatus Methylopumilus planktonicus TaxID=1581557 RepID=UPI00111D1BD0|nr:sulfotransferase [Candidatus Methylopumilus planktonicus]QDD07408.1 tetratricopeptide repeat protein [Candidatus Methylopumilus planktonicus]QDD08737.1 tetratricopeptide repeat protein [Candidatus Methylopumilus planktonicus]QDD10059.1 tetratricopeptide repeat protein [Candidatus Methylopumilus planktonicus]
MSSKKIDNELDEVQLLFQHKQIDHCISKINKIIKNHKKEFLPYNYRGIIFLSLYRYPEALNDFKKAISLNPEFAQGYNNIALAYRSLNLRGHALSAYKKSLSLNPESIEARINIGILYTELYLYFEAIESFNYVLKRIPEHEHTHQLIADAYLKTFNYEQALQHLISANKINPLNHFNYFLIGTYYMWTGEREKSSQYFRKSLEINSTYGQSYYGLSRVENIKLDDPLFTQAINLLKSENISDDEKVFLHFFIAKIYESMSKVDLFFNHLNQGCTIQKKLNQYNFDHTRSLQQKIENVYEKHSLDLREIINKSSDIKTEITPIFVIGMPRSGTSLIEQILSGHSMIFGAGELSIINDEMEKILLLDYKQNEFIENILNLRRAYLNFLKAISNKVYVTDKLPLNFHWLGFIKLIFPNAKIINIKRDPIATAFSIYKTLFVRGALNFSYSFSDIIQYFKLYESAMNFWSRNLPDDVLNISYHKLVENPRFYINQMCEFIEVPFEENMIDISLNNRPVHTASDQQIRDKIRSENTQLWKKYENFLQEFVEGLA